MIRPTRVLVVDDSALMRRILSETLSATGDLVVVGEAPDPLVARRMIKELSPDVLTLDVEMPHMHGLDFLEKIMALRPMPVVMVSTLTQRGAETTLEALEIGAVDFVPKPTMAEGSAAWAGEIGPFGAELVAKVRNAALARVLPRGPRPAAPRPVPTAAAVERSRDAIVAIGASTGGVEALRDIVLALAPNAPPMVATQHMPEFFTASFAARLDREAAITVVEAVDGMRVQPGTLHIAAGGKHLELVRRAGYYMCRVKDGPLVSGHRPSVDVLFRSVAAAAGADALGVILTGMGRDGAEGMREMRAAGALTIGQSEASCVVYGMPKAARELGAVTLELPLGKIAAQIAQFAGARSAARHAG